MHSCLKEWTLQALHPHVYGSVGSYTDRVWHTYDAHNAHNLTKVADHAQCRLLQYCRVQGYRVVEPLGLDPKGPWIKSQVGHFVVGLFV